MLALVLDTSSDAVVAAVVSIEHQVVTVLAERSPIAARGHGELLSPCIAECLHEAGIGPRDIGAVVAGVGPGPFTGLRVGLVTAAAFADAIGAPAYGVCSLDAIAAAEPGAGDLVVLTDARRHEVYWARYDGDRRRTDGPHVCRPGGVPAGTAAVVSDQHPHARHLAALALDRLAGGAPGEPLTPLYLRRPDAVVPAAPKAVSQWS